jgi:hypothetical protein
MASIASLEQGKANKIEKTFDMELAVNILACSLPFTTLVMLTVFSFGELFTSPATLLLLGLTMISIGIIKPILKWFNLIEYEQVFENKSQSS